MKKIKKVTRVMGFLAFAALIAVAFTTSLQAYSGSLQYASGITASDGWGNDLTTFSWVVLQDNGLWSYEYKFTVPEVENEGLKELSHLIIEVSTGTDLNDFSGDISWIWGEDWELGTYSSANGNPDMPESMYGLKFQEGSWSTRESNSTSTTYIISFKSTRAPVWGDFYAKDGKSSGIDVTAWNTGFTVTDPSDDPSDGSVNNHILRPDTKGTGFPVPEPSTMMFLGLGLMCLAEMRRRITK